MMGFDARKSRGGIGVLKGGQRKSGDWVYFTKTGIHVCLKKRMMMNR
jgi:hypothetical protein